MDGWLGGGGCRVAAAVVERPGEVGVEGFLLGGIELTKFLMGFDNVLLRVVIEAGIGGVVAC